MSKFTLQNLPQETWNRCKQRSDAEGWDIYALVERLMDDYGHGRLTPTGPPVKKRTLTPPADGT